jgi:hypothetical protein
MLSKFVLLMGLLSAGVVDSVFYLYDRNHNRAVRYDFTDAGNIYYKSQNFHSVDYIQRNGTTFAKKVNSSRSLPVMRLT